jgi:uncharacterized protein (DUF488 family)
MPAKLLERRVVLMHAIIWTIGHSNHELPYFLEMLASSAIELVADVRLMPGSRRYPQFHQQNLAASLSSAGIAYQHFPALGGRRRQRAPNSPNTGWRVEAFNAYADHTMTTEFVDAFGELQNCATAGRTAVMCAEAVPWRCHRRIIADAFIAIGWRVLDIFSPTQTKEHQLTEFARVAHGHVSYPDPNPVLFSKTPENP